MEELQLANQEVAGDDDTSDQEVGDVDNENWIFMCINFSYDKFISVPSSLYLLQMTQGLEWWLR